MGPYFEGRERQTEYRNKNLSRSVFVIGFLCERPVKVDIRCPMTCVERTAAT